MVELLLILAAAAAAAAALAGLGYLLVWFLLHGRRDGPQIPSNKIKNTTKPAR